MKKTVCYLLLMLIVSFTYGQYILDKSDIPYISKGSKKCFYDEKKALFYFKDYPQKLCNCVDSVGGEYIEELGGYNSTEVYILKMDKL